MLEILIWILIFGWGVITGFAAKAWLTVKRDYGGVITVTRDGDKLVYSLELQDDPVEIQYKKEVLFKVDTPEESPDRN